VLEDAAVDWMLTRTVREPAQLVDLIERLDRASLAAKRRVTVPFLRQVLADE
jgi:DnaA family protein